MEHRSEQINELISSLIKAKSEMGSASKDRKGFNYKYADLSAIMEVCEDALLENGIFLAQPVITNGDSDYLHTQLLHTSGQWMESYVKLFVSEGAGKLSDHQEWGKAVTYMRRYCLQSLIGIATEDNDGATATTKPYTPRPMASPANNTTANSSAKPSDVGGKISPAQVNEIIYELSNYPSLAKDILEKFEITNFSDMKESLFQPTMRRIRELQLAEPIKKS